MKVAIICKSLKVSNIRNQPWRYVIEISRYLASVNHEIIIITDSNEETNTLEEYNLQIVRLNRITGVLGDVTDDLIKIINLMNPDVILMLLGTTSFIKLDLQIDRPIIGLFTSPRYSLCELIRNVGIRDLIVLRKYTSIHLIGSLIPRYFFKTRSSNFKKIIVLSTWNANKLIDLGIPSDKIQIIPAGLDRSFLKKPEIESINNLRNEYEVGNDPIILYYTSALSLRGSDTLLKAFSYVCREEASKLIFLFRPDDSFSVEQEQCLRRRAIELGIDGSILFISKNLNSDEIRSFLGLSDMIVLPFKLVISDLPLSILEAEASNKPVISTSVGCIPEMIGDAGIIVKPNDPMKLAEAILTLIREQGAAKDLGNEGNRRMLEYQSWDEVGEKINNVIMKANSSIGL